MKCKITGNFVLLIVMDIYGRVEVDNWPVSK